ncbi:DUF1614 domain-containing protein [Planctomicrobium sp. SH668]|uniref:DUF1614 domain-containing protein n=1 Tax=Planctomicrobium sp. SH668 TaxID=3448126 RepID=UPI003F5B3A75
MPVQFRIGQSGGRLPISPIMGCLPVLLLAAAFFLSLYFFSALIIEKFEPLGLSFAQGALFILAILFGTPFHLPVYRNTRDELIQVDQRFQRDDGDAPPMMSTYEQIKAETVVSLNIGGGIIPIGMAIYQLIRLAEMGQRPFGIAASTILIAALSTYFLVPMIQKNLQFRHSPIALLITPFLSVVAIWIMLPHATPDQKIATGFVAGVFGQVIGHELRPLLAALQSQQSQHAVIGKFGTFSKIVISTFLTMLLA